MTDEAKPVPYCPYCGKPAPEPEKLLGRKVRCGKCRGKYRLPEALGGPVVPLEAPGERPKTEQIPISEAAKLLEAMKRETVVEPRVEPPTVFPLRDAPPQPPPAAPAEAPAATSEGSLEPTPMPQAAPTSAEASPPTPAPATALPKEIPSAYFEKYQTRRRVVDPETRRKILEPPPAAAPAPPALSEAAKALEEAARALPDAPTASPPSRDPSTWAARDTKVDKDKTPPMGASAAPEGTSPAAPSAVADFKWEAPKPAPPPPPKKSKAPLVALVLLFIVGGAAAVYYFGPWGESSSLPPVPGDASYSTATELKRRFDAVYYTARPDEGLPMVYVAVKGGAASVYLKSLMLDPLGKKVCKLDDPVLATCLGVGEGNAKVLNQTFNGKTVTIVFKKYADKQWKTVRLTYTLNAEDVMK